MAKDGNHFIKNRFRQRESKGKGCQRRRQYQTYGEGCQRRKRRNEIGSEQTGDAG